MAQLHPREHELHRLPVPLDEGEQQLLAALAQLDDDWIVFVQPCLGLDGSCRAPASAIRGRKPEGSHRVPADLIPVAATFAARHVGGAQASPLLPEDHPHRAGDYRPTVRRWVNLPRGKRLGQEIGEQVISLLDEHPELSESEVVFLAPTHHDGLDAVSIIEAAGHHVHHIFGRTKQEQAARKGRIWGRSPGVKGCREHSFKGWGARAVVLSVDRGANSHRLAYVGLTRVKGDPIDKSAFVTVVNRDLAVTDFSTYFEAS